GECVPYARYGEMLESVSSQIEAVREQIETGVVHENVVGAMPPGAARNAVDCAFWDLNAKSSGISAYKLVCEHPPRPVTTATTISLGTASKMADAAKAVAEYPSLKVKLGGEGDIERIHAVTDAAPESRIILDANEAWSADNISQFMLEAAKANVALIEQPLPKGNDAILADIPHPVPICADESAHTADDLADLVGRYDCINVKLDKTGGLTEAIKMRRRAHEMGFSVMVGCMVGTSLSMAPAVLLAQDAEFVDLDGPLILEKDRANGLEYVKSLVAPPTPKLWG
ncbi:MAG: N-acetyl-D-Glu racemase DgcA, partial [Rhizobiaceae bacterium]